MPDRNGYTRRAHLESGARQGMLGAQLDLIGPGDLPEGLWHVWTWYLELAGARGSSGFGWNPIGWPELAAWQRLTGARPLAHELDWLLALDRAFRAAHAKGAGDGSAEVRGAA